MTIVMAVVIAVAFLAAMIGLSNLLKSKLGFTEPGAWLLTVVPVALGYTVFLVWDSAPMHRWLIAAAVYAVIGMKLTQLMKERREAGEG
ncbi:hypothetical protein [Alteribacter natronophilus]|uniref:hypothetical protein n=1 Tax=Alteribacter natronophilus TaxID=2583810 RepID=UPI00110EC105|nr:hypothetical protein [Alteribacter natronophilus]TMW72785.1 hypothetical protein FGB90_00280 [Alteribacter natronophilus]